jgi:DNA-binding NarL/FixJ family response regulator
MKAGMISPIRVLVADDSPVVRKRLAALLNEVDCIQVVGEAQSAFEAMLLFEERRPDAVVLDFQFPDASGLEVLRRIKHSAPLCLVIILTTFREPAFKSICLAAGADHFFHKATEFERVPEVLSEAARHAIGSSGPAPELRENSSETHNVVAG